jgi:hypothetical protein
MFKSIIGQSLTAIAGAALVAALTVFLTSPIPQARAETQAAIDQPRVKGDPLPVLIKGDRLPVQAKGTACSSRGWPYYERKCEFDFRRPADETRTVRVIALR